MAEDYTVLTPENVELRFETAGLGSRVAAALIDYTIIVVGYGLLSIGGTFASAFVATLSGADSALIVRLTEYVIVALVILLTFFGWWGYFILGELLWNGQSIGKRRLGLRVVRAGGQPVSLVASLVRNVVRVVDVFLGVGVIVMLIDRQGRRLGDLAAGTLVIRESRVTSLIAATVFDPVVIPSVDDRHIEDLPNADRLTSAHYAVIREYFARSQRLPTRRAVELATALAQRVAANLDVPTADLGDPIAFLATAARAYEVRQNRSLN